MRKFTIPDVDTFIAAIQDEISRTPEGRYFHRLHVILYVLQGHSTYEAARIYGHSPRTIQYWVQRLISHGLAGLWDREHPGRPCQLSQSDEKTLRNELRRSPRELGYEQNLWDGPLLSHHVREHYGATLSVRQCQRLFHKLGFSLQRPRGQPHEANPIRQEIFKKTSTNG
jgi:transposase